jgi:hypothetical protein
MLVLVMVVTIVIVMMLMIMMLLVVCRMLVRIVLMMFAMSLVRLRFELVMTAAVGVRSLEVLRFGCRLGAGALDDLAADAIATAAAARIAMARAAAVVAVLVLFLGLAMGALVGLDQRLTVGDRDLIVVGMDFAEGEKAVAVAAIFDERRLQRRLDAGNLGQIDVAAKLLALRGLEIKLFDSIATNDDDPGLLRVGGIDQHFVGHFVTHDGGRRVSRRAQDARPEDATVHLIRG